MSHKHLTIFERDKIAISYAKGKSLSVIAAELKRHKSTISRELNRNGDSGKYYAHAAQIKTQARKRGKPAMKMDDPEIAKVVKEKLRQDHSPEIISGRLKIGSNNISIGRQTIYDWINSEEKKGRKWRRCLPRRGKAYSRRYGENTANNSRRPIAERPQIVDKRRRIGDWEGDTLEGRKGGEAVITLVERFSRYTVLCAVENRSSESLNGAVKERFNYQRKFPRHSLTVDRGREFGDGSRLEKTFKADVYFTDAHSPWQKGLVEQTNGLLRRYLPKGFDKSCLKKLELAEDRLNHRPRKCLGFLTPYEVLFGIKLA